MSLPKWRGNTINPRSGIKDIQTWPKRYRSEPANSSGNDEPSTENDSIIYSDCLNNIEKFCYKMFNFERWDLNKLFNHFYGVVNLSSYMCSLTGLSVLGMGLKFCPTPLMYDHGPLKEQIDKLFRNISLHLFFKDINLDRTHSADELINTPFEHPDLVHKSKFTPQSPVNLQLIYHLIIEDILSHNPSHHRSRNLTNAQYTAFLKLSDNNNIIIKKADKGSNIVIMDKCSYELEAIKQLSDNQLITIR